MRTLVRTITLCLAVAALTAVGASAATRPFTANAKLGKATVSGGIVTERGSATTSLGNATLLLLSKGGNGRFNTTAKFSLPGGKLVFKGVTKTGAVKNPNNYGMRGTWTVSSGTGKYLGYHGSVTLTGEGVNDLSKVHFTLKGSVGK